MSSTDIQGRTVLVTGAASGIGLATAQRLLRDGANVVGADIQQPIDDVDHEPGRFEFFEPIMHEEAIERLDLKADLQRALDDGQFSLNYQPIFDLKTGKVDLVEALIRWRHPDRGAISPERFAPFSTWWPNRISWARIRRHARMRASSRWKSYWMTRAPHPGLPICRSILSYTPDKRGCMRMHFP